MAVYFFLVGWVEPEIETNWQWSSETGKETKAQNAGDYLKYLCSTHAHT